MADSVQLVKFCNRFACFTFKNLRKSFSCPIPNFWTFCWSGDKYCTVNLWAGIELRSPVKQCGCLFYCDSDYSHHEVMFYSSLCMCSSSVISIGYKPKYFCISKFHVGKGYLFEQLGDPFVCTKVKWQIYTHIYGEYSMYGAYLLR